MRSRTRYYGPSSHRRVGSGVKGGKGFMARVRNMSSGTFMREEGANSVCGLKLNDQIVFKGRVRKLGRVPDFGLFFLLSFLGLGEVGR